MGSDIVAGGARSQAANEFFSLPRFTTLPARTSRLPNQTIDDEGTPRMTFMSKFRPLRVPMVVGLLLAAGCSKAPQAPVAVAEAPPGKPVLGIRPSGDEETKIDMSRISPDIKPVFDYIDTNIDQHVVNLQNWIRQPSISNTGEGMQESAEMVKGFFDQLGCQESKVYDVGVTEWGQQGNPVVYAKCDEGAQKTLVVYWMYDTMPVTQPDLWKAPPFEAQIVEQEPFKKVLIGRGATNSKGPQMTFYNALMSIKAVKGKLPVNIIFVAEGDEERMSIGYRKFVREHKELFQGVDAMWGPGGSEGCVFVELTTSGAKWGRGPNYSDIHGGNKRSVDAPAWRHIQMLSTLTDKTGNKVLIDGFYDNIEPLKPEEKAALKRAAEKLDLKVAAKRLGVERFISDDPLTQITMARYGTSINLDGIWGGNMFAGGSGAILPNKITSKHNFRYVPNMTGPDIVAKLRKHLDKHGYNDVEINVVGDVPWAKMSQDSELGRAVSTSMLAFGQQRADPIPFASIISGAQMGGYWPAYLFAGDVLDIPIAGGFLGSGGNAHAANEYFVIEGSGKTFGMASAEKMVVTALYTYAGLNTPAAATPPATAAVLPTAQ
jgi:acetylornithine deacetylase/succinyl-diaminopimelate desuccinylase-like protein